MTSHDQSRFRPLGPVGAPEGSEANTTTATTVTKATAVTTVTTVTNHNAQQQRQQRQQRQPRQQRQQPQQQRICYADIVLSSFCFFFKITNSHGLAGEIQYYTHDVDDNVANACSFATIRVFLRSDAAPLPTSGQMRAPSWFQTVLSGVSSRPVQIIQGCLERFQTVLSGFKRC